MVDAFNMYYLNDSLYSRWLAQVFTMKKILITIGFSTMLIGVIIFKQNQKFSFKDPYKLFAIFIGIAIIFLSTCVIILGL
ncbi:hypothetical protein B2D45_11080 [Lactobacillus hilgardii]|uniref:Uncharacterized protein n=2 Tax=Lentilactobacillus hilgardii TaxID=1588 RepID=C0XGN1_LENH9|nr:hypothetical protein HMPREF0497_1580 [Lentilactobacillus buchneri ATCC 11577]EEI25443.1 hypothetical protein HMPREF0519_0392 [Lentilactobacillus hilgardii DSM 20176 = ATCC 8290]KRK56812.1 hypothetical protein FD42_GL002543 [Lentilactobacillus hilgardii DSM 20176 = ATCC 8290]QEU39817.1 hypothetical protein LH500_11335 [Lentilactobacillus hilgardii]